jgi:signal transduction histidine kinase
MLGHELRNPLAAVRKAVAIASLDETRRATALDIARRQVEQLARLIDDLLDVARITQGRISLRKETVYLGPVIERAIESVRSFIESRGLTSRSRWPPNPSASTRHDLSRSSGPSFRTRRSTRTRTDTST